MRKTITPILLALSTVAYTQGVATLLEVNVPDKTAKADSSGDASYRTPLALANIGSIYVEDNAVCNYLFPNDEINEGAYILASGDKPVVYLDTSSNSPSSRHWEAPGTAEAVSNTKDLEVHYNKEGVFCLPSLTVTTLNGTSTYAPDLYIKSGGMSEITTINTREYGETYQFGAYSYSDGNGYVGGTNKVGIAGWGNLFMFGTDEAYMDGVNIYFHHKPAKMKDDTKLLVQVWLPSITENDIMFTSIPLEAEYVKLADIKDASDGVWVPAKGAAVASVEFDPPLDLYGKTILFISVEGFGSDVENDDLCMLMDVKGAALDEINMGNRIAHNSFGRLTMEYDYLRPISYYGGGTGSFAICPVIRTYIAPTSIESIDTNNDGSFKATMNGDVLDIDTDVCGIVSVYDIYGRLLQTANVSVGHNTLHLNWDGGILLVKGPKDNTVKICK